MNKIRLISLIATLAWFSGVSAELILIDEAIEAYEIKISINDSGKGHVSARSCERCPFVRLKVTHDTKITVNGAAVPTGKLLKQDWEGGVVIYNVKTKHVTQLML